MKKHIGRFFKRIGETFDPSVKACLPMKEQRTLIGMVCFGNAGFSRIAVDEIRKTATEQFDLAIVIAKPGDQLTHNWAETERVKYGAHLIFHYDTNRGFPAS